MSPLELQIHTNHCLDMNVWQCGPAGPYLFEHEDVIKVGLAMGGALCCRDTR